jgi:hypothetical protein
MIEENFGAGRNLVSSDASRCNFGIGPSVACKVALVLADNLPRSNNNETGRETVRIMEGSG